jgi:hypothetical protein
MSKIPISIAAEFGVEYYGGKFQPREFKGYVAVGEPLITHLDRFAGTKGPYTYLKPLEKTTCGPKIFHNAEDLAYELLRYSLQQDPIRAYEIRWVSHLGKSKGLKLPSRKLRRELTDLLTDVGLIARVKKEIDLEEKRQRVQDSKHIQLIKKLKGSFPKIRFH